MPTFYIVGSGRCGTTLLRRCLSQIQGIYIPPENHILGPSVKRRIVHREEDWASFAAWFEKALLNFPDFKYFNIDLDMLLLRLKHLPRNMQNARGAMSVVYDLHLRSQVTMIKYLGDKTPMNVFYLDDILSTVPEAKFINLIRDGVDVVESFLRIGRYITVDSAARRWKLAIEAAESFAEKNNKNIITIKYEDLVIHPRKILKSICHFLAIDYSERMMHCLTLPKSLATEMTQKHHENATLRLTSTNIGLGKSELSSEDLKKIRELVGDTLQRLGYQLPQIK